MVIPYIFKKNQAIEFLHQMSTLGLIIIYPLSIVMLKRFIFILVLLTISFFIYRKINPEGAQTLINKANTLLGRTGDIVSLTGDAVTPNGSGLTEQLFTGTVLTGESITGTSSTGGLMANIAMDTGTLTSCVAEGSFANEALGGPANCCKGLQGFSTGQGIRMQVDPGQLCYDPLKGIPHCTTIGNKEGRYSSGMLLILDDCITTPITDTVVVPSVKTSTTPTPQKTTTTTKTTTKPKTSSEIKDTQNLINNLFE